MSDIHTALAAVMADCTHVAKRDRNEHQRFLFRGIDAVVNAVGPILREHSVTVRPVVQSVAYDLVQTSTGKPATACRVVVDYVFAASDGSELTSTVAAEAWDNGDKAAPKAMSVAFRTALLQTLALPTDEPDPDSHTYTQAETPAAKPRAQRKSTPLQTAPAETAADGMAKLTPQQRGLLFKLFERKGIPEADQLTGIAYIIGRQIEHRDGPYTRAEFDKVLAALEARPDAVTQEAGQ